MVIETNSTGTAGHAIERFNNAAAACPTGERNFTAGFIGALSVGFDDMGKLDKTAWDRAIRISLENANRIHADRLVAE
jgi:hypothetical protein